MCHQCRPCCPPNPAEVKRLIEEFYATLSRGLDGKSAPAGVP